MAERRYFSTDSMTKIDPELEGGDAKELLAAIASEARMGMAKVNLLTGRPETALYLIHTALAPGSSRGETAGQLPRRLLPTRCREGLSE